eukprot:CAMPEP_0179208546 /NCGR_PEP_ID=MMETSP0796-20121207/104004_1 /TAXON_ID=73915 /ORGANISM="Pyrodinium bahamense, Strain pbaha01" /LENGTH=405 /DNA_ID=CAMNT_0020913497 /DNA_START=88 /DNA_END=1306 /DNA_ORIENTATION=-
MTERELADAIEVIPDRLYWAALHTTPKNTLKSHYFCIDNELVYEPFFADFGPLNLSMIYRYCKMLEVKIMDPALAEKRIIHYCSHDPRKRANAACLVCAYQVIALGKCNLWHLHVPPTIVDCLKGLEESIKHRWFDWSRFDVESYDFFEKVENGDMNWIIPDKFLAFAGPCPTPTDADGFPALTPEDYVPIFREAGIGLVVRLNKKQYERRRFIDHEIKHVEGAVAVHCKAGLGRTGTLIGLYAMKHYQFPARAFIGWNRICRPGSILGPQQQFLLDMQTDMIQAGVAMRRPPVPPSSLGADAERMLCQQVDRLNLRDRTQAEQFEDPGQGDRLCNAKRGQRGAAPNMAVPPPPADPFLPPVGRQPGPPPDSAGTNQEFPRGPSAKEQRPVVGMIHRSLRGVFSP